MISFCLFLGCCVSSTEQDGGNEFWHFLMFQTFSVTESYNAELHANAVIKIKQSAVARSAVCTAVEHVRDKLAFLVYQNRLVYPDGLRTVAYECIGLL